MTARNNRDQMVIATKYSAGYVKHRLDDIPIQSNYAGNSAKSMYLSVRDSLKKLQTEYIDILYVHYWDFATSVEEVMRALHKYVMANQVLYLGASDVPAWVVVKANEFARRHGLTPFSVYQGRWNAAYRDMEAEIVPMCEDQGMAIVPWAALGGGRLMAKEQREKRKEGGRGKVYDESSEDEAVCDAVEDIATAKNCTFQAVCLAYLFAQSTYVFPIVGVQSVEHVEAMADSLKIELTKEEVQKIQKAKRFKPLFPIEYLFGGFNEAVDYSTKLTAADSSQHQMWAWIDAPPKQGSYIPHSEL